MIEAAIPWLMLVVCAVMIGFAGHSLTRYAGAISNLTGLPGSWIGLVLLSAATSLPELFTGVSSVAVFDAPDIAMGDALGSCVLNLVLLVLLDVMCPDEPIYSRIDQRHVLTAGFGVILIGIAGLTILTADTGIGPMLFHVSAYTPLVILVYFVAVRATFLHERRLAITAPESVEPSEALSLSQAITRYIAAALVVGVAGGVLPHIGTQIAEATGWQASFVGTLFVALATSLPEAVVVLSAMRRNAADMAIAALLGSNLFDVLILAIDDLAYTRGSIFADVSPVHASSAFAGVIMSGIFIVALLYRPKNRFFGHLNWVSLSLLTVYFLSSYFIYLYEN